MKEVNIL